MRLMNWVALAWMAGAGLVSAQQGPEEGIIVTGQGSIAAAPDIIIGSWCGKKVRPEKIAARPGWDAIPAVANGRITEIKSPLILQPGPAALGDGLDAILAALA